jgi:hypothetical protein
VAQVLTTKRIRGKDHKKPLPLGGRHVLEILKILLTVA